MKRRLTILTLTALTVVTLISVVLTVSSPAYAGGAMRIWGVGYPDLNDDCPLPPEEEWPDGTIFAVPPLWMTGSLEGCFYSFALSAESSPSGTYRERGIDIFVGDLVIDGETIGTGKFETTYLFTAKFDEEGNEIWGRCQHPITAGSDTAEGVFEFVATGRLDLKDDVEAGEFPYTGFLRW